MVCIGMVYCCFVEINVSNNSCSLVVAVLCYTYTGITYNYCLLSQMGMGTEGLKMVFTFHINLQSPRTSHQQQFDLWAKTELLLQRPRLFATCASSNTPPNSYHISLPVCCLTELDTLQLFSEDCSGGQQFSISLYVVSNHKLCCYVIEL